MATVRWPDVPEWLDALEWALRMVEHGTAGRGMAKTGMAAIGLAETGMATGVIIDSIIDSITDSIIDSITASSSLVTSAFRGGGAGAGVRPGAGAIRTGTDTMVMATRMATATVPRTATAMEAPNTVTTGTVMDMAIMEMDTAIPAGPEWLSYSAGSLAPAITTGPSMEFWVPELAGLFAHTRLTTATRAEQVSFGYG